MGDRRTPGSALGYSREYQEPRTPLVVWQKRPPATDERRPLNQTVSYSRPAGKDACKLKMNIENSNNNSFTFTGSLVSDIVNFVGLGTKLEALRASIAAALAAEIKASGATVAQAAKVLRAELKGAGVSKQDASKALVALGIRERAASAGKTEEAEKLAEALKPVIEALKEAAKNGTSDIAEAVAVLRRAHLSLAAEIKANAAA